MPGTFAFDQPLSPNCGHAQVPPAGIPRALIILGRQNAHLGVFQLTSDV
jgi:hypothetical protein